MSFSKISILVPTRKRINFLSNMLNSYFETVIDPCLSEFVFWCDNDDVESVRFLSNYGWQILVGPRLDGYKSLPVFFNQMAKVSNGDLLICANDDMRFTTLDWQSKIIDFANNYPDGIFNIGVSTGLNDDKFPFSIVSRIMVEKMGMINDPRLLFSDIFLLDVAKHFGRAFRTNDVSFIHDWAGHTDDEVRREANQHEFAEVFADNTGAWSEKYRLLHEQVVGEAVQKIDPQLTMSTDLLLNDFEKYQPSNQGSVRGIWPPKALAVNWDSQNGTGIDYNKDETKELFKVMFDQKIGRDCIVLSSYNNGLPSMLFGTLFDKVITIKETDFEEEKISDGKHQIEFGSAANGRFISKIFDASDNINAIVLDSRSYARIIGPYFLGRRKIQKPGIVIFVDIRPRDDLLNNGMYEFLVGLQAGNIDGICHDIKIIKSENGRGIAYEIIK